MATILLVVGNAASLTFWDTAFQGRIEAAGHTVTVIDDNTAEPSEATYDGIAVSDSSSGGTVQYGSVAKPGLTSEQPTSWSLGTNVGGVAGTTDWTVNDVPPQNGGLTGTQTVYSGAGLSQQALTPSGTHTVVATRTTGEAVYVTWEPGDSSTGVAAKRCFIRIPNHSSSFLTAAGTTLLDAAIDWTFGGASTVSGVATVTLGALDVAVTAGPQTKTGTAAVDLGALSVTAIGFREPVTVTGTAAVTPGGLAVTAVGGPVRTGTASVSLGALSVTAIGTSEKPPPGQVYDLSRWHLTLPTEDPGPDTDAAQIDQPALATYTDANFFTDVDGMMVCVAPVVGATTSGASGATRCELRQHESGTYANSAWNPSTTGRRQLTVTTHADASSITGGTNPRKEAIIGQIHGAGDSPIPLILSAEYHVSPTRVRIFKNGPGLDNPVLNITPTTAITYRIRVENARVKLWVIAGQVADLPSVADPAPYDWPISDFTDQTGWYYKSGIYNKTEIDSGSTGQSTAKISFIQVLEPADPEPGDTVTGTSTVTLGALDVAATGMHTVHGTADFTLGALDVAVVGTAFPELVEGTAAVTLGALSVTATGVGIAETVTGSAALPLGALSVTAASTVMKSGTAVVTLGALSVVAGGGPTVTGIASVSLGAVSVTAVGTGVAEVVTGTASVALAGLTITASGSRVVAGTAAVTLASLAVTVLGTILPGGSPRLRAGTPTVVHGPTAGTPTAVRGLVASTPAVR